MILNLTTMLVCDRLRELGVVDLDPTLQLLRDEVLTFDEHPVPADYHYRTDVLVVLAHTYPAVMIDPPPYLAGPLEAALIASGCRVYYPYRSPGGGFSLVDATPEEVDEP